MTARSSVARAVTVVCLLCALGCQGSLAQPSPAPPGADAPVGPADVAVTYVSTPGESLDIGGVFRRFRRARYGLVVTNQGPGLARDTTLTLALRSQRGRDAPLYPAETTVLTVGSGACDRQPWGSFTPVIVCRLGEVAPGQRIAVEIGALVHQTGPIYATAEVASAAEDPAPDNNRALMRTEVTCEGCMRK